ncbi:MAG: hypothetical protein CMH35_12295, partial [Microbacterium sp.]|nr:hypothetical protein [Microbacterium sp.]
MRVRRRALVAAVALAVLTGCAGGPTGEPGGSGEPELRAALIQLRADVAERHAQVRVENLSGAAVRIGDVAVVDPRFVADAVRLVDRESTVPAGGSIDIRVQLPAVACDIASSAGPTVRLELIADGTSRTVALPIADPLGFAGPLHERECRAEALAAAADIAFTGFSPSPSGEPALLRMEIVPVGDGDAEVTAVQQTNLLTFGDATVDGVLPIGGLVQPGKEPTTLDLPVVPTRCDAHAVQEDKRGTIFDVRVSVAGE